MLNSWTHEWSWLDFRKQHSKLTEQEAKAKFLLEQQKYEADMHTLYMQSINGPAGGGAASTGGGDPIIQFRYDTGKAIYTTDSTGYYGGVLDTANFDTRYPSEPTNRLIVFGTRGNSFNDGWAKDPLTEEDFLTIDWGDGVITTVDRDTTGVGPDVWNRSWSSISNSQGFTSVYMWHRYPTPGEYTVTVTGTTAYMETVAPGLLARSANYRGNQPNAPAELGSLIYLQPWRAITKYTKFDNVLLTPWEIGYTLLGQRSYLDIDISDLSIEKNWVLQPPARSEEDYARWDDINVEAFAYNFTFYNTVGLYKLYDAFLEKDWSKENSLNWMFFEADFGYTPDPVQYPVPDLSTMDVSNVTHMIGTFWGTPHVGEQLNLSNWDTSKVVSLSQFTYAGTALSETGTIGLVGASARSCANWNLNSLENAYRCWGNRSAVGGISDADLEYVLKGWADNPNTANNVTAAQIGGFTTRTYSSGSDMDLAIQALTAKGWTISGITIS